MQIICVMGKVGLSPTEWLLSQAAFYKIDIDNPDVQTSVSNHDISGVVSHRCNVLRVT